jgi:hypothetical protein
MTTTVVTTQTELGAALADAGVDTIHIKSPAGVWLQLSSSGSASVRAYGSASVEASDSASVRAYGSASVRAYGSASVRAYDSASVRAYGSASVEASGSASVEASGSASVEASGSASVRAYGSASVRASTNVAVYLHSAHATVDGGVVIDLTTLDLTDPATWAGHHGVDTAGDEGDTEAILYKAVSPELTAGERYDRPTTYNVGAVVAAPDWRPDNECGGGLHISPRPGQAKRYREYENGTRYLRVAALLDSLRPISSDKCKAPQVRVLAEVDIDGRDLPVPAGNEAVA